MKTQLLTALFLLTLTFTGCISKTNTNNSGKISTTEEVRVKLLLENYLDGFLNSNKDCFNNDITKEECTKMLAVDFLLTQLGDSINCITQLPLQYKQMAKYNDNKYVVKFEYGKESSKHTLSSNYITYFQVFSIVDKKTASMLKEGENYYLKGRCYSYANRKTFTMPSGTDFAGGTYYDGATTINKDSYGKTRINLGTLIVENLSFTKTF